MEVVVSDDCFRGTGGSEHHLYEGTIEFFGEVSGSVGLTISYFALGKYRGVKDYLFSGVQKDSDRQMHSAGNSQEGQGFH